MRLTEHFLSLTLFVGLILGSFSSSRLGAFPTDQETTAIDFASVPSRRLQTCASEGERSKQCGADGDDRPDECCDGLICVQARCEKSEICAKENEVAKECGARQDNRPQSCCPGFVCGDDKDCVASDDVDETGAPTNAPTMLDFATTEAPVAPAPTEAPTIPIEEIETMSPTLTPSTTSPTKPLTPPPTGIPTGEPTLEPTQEPTRNPSITYLPTASPSSGGMKAKAPVGAFLAFTVTSFLINVFMV